MLETLEALCRLNGISGDENEVREFIISKIKDHCEYSVDPLGNVIAFKKGRNRSKNKVMVAAHMDEVGMIVTYINESGTLSISPVGGVEASVCIGRTVTVGSGNTNGVIGSKAVHNLSEEERKTPPEFSALYVDIGAESREEAEKYIKLGDSVCFRRDFSKLGNNMFVSKAIDDRAGCAIMLDMIKSDMKYDMYFVFTVQEEIGTRGARTAAFSVAPDFALVLETTTAADIPSVEGAKRVCELGKGAVVSYMDRSSVYDRELYKIAFQTAEENGISVQTKTMIAGGNDGGAIHLSGSGVRTIAVSAPCRYLHSPSVAMDINDFKACRKLSEIMLEKMCCL